MKFLITFLFLLPFFANANSQVSYFSSLSEKFQKTWKNQSCAEINSNSLKALNIHSCRSDDDHKSLDEITEHIFFNKLANNQLQKWQCLGKNISSVSADFKQSLFQDLKKKASLLKLIKVEKARLEVLLKAQRSKLLKRTQRYPAFPEYWQKEKTTVETTAALLLKLDQSIESIYSSAWQGHNPLVRNFLDEFSDNSNVGTLLGSMQDEASKNSKKLLSFSENKTPPFDFNLNDANKISLFQDSQELQDTFADLKSEKSALKGVYCRLNQRYGEGRKELRAALSVGTTATLLLVSGGSYALLGAGSAARVISTVAIAGGTTSLVTEVDNSCGKNKIEQLAGRNACSSLTLDSPALTQTLEKNNCALNVALASLDLPFPEIKAAAGIIGLGKTAEKLKKFDFTDTKKFSIKKSKLMGAKELSIEDTVNKKLVARLDYEFTNKSKTQIEVTAFTSPNYREGGANSLLFKKMLDENPQVVKIQTNLTETNEEVFKKFKSYGASDIEAIKATPAYKVRAENGFTEIVDYSYEVVDGDHLVTFVVRNPNRVPANASP